MRAYVGRLAKPWVVMPLVAVIVLAGWWLLRGGTQSSAADGASVPTEQVVEASLGNVNLTVSAEGTIAYAQSEDLSFTASGTVTAVHVVAGQTVKEGEILAELDSPELEAAVAEAETSVAEAAATLADGAADGASDARQAANRSALATANDRLDSAQDALDGATLVASFDGTISTVDITEGEKLASGGTGGTTMTGSGSGSGQTGAGIGSGSSGIPGGSSQTSSTSSSPHIQVVSEGDFVVDIGFDDTDIAQVAVGQEAQIELSSSSGSGGFPGFGGGGGGFPGSAEVAVSPAEVASLVVAASPVLAATRNPVARM